MSGGNDGKPERISDEKLVQAAKGGDAQAWEEIISRYRNLIRPKNDVKFLVGAEENDVVQERLLGLYFAVKEFDEKRSPCFSAFAKRCIENHLSTAITAALRKKHSPLNSYVSLDKDTDEEGSFVMWDFVPADSVRNPEEILIDRESRNDIECRINKELSSLESEVLTKYLDGWSYKEIAGQLKKDEKSVDNAMQRIKRRFKRKKDIIQKDEAQ